MVKAKLLAPSPSLPSFMGVLPALSHNPLPHHPVLLQEVLELLSLQEDGNYLDCTYGAGGYTNAILDKVNCHVTAIDQDPTVSRFVRQTKNKFNNRFNFYNINFANAKQYLTHKFNGIVLDLGISSMQIDTRARGFSFMHDGPLDMRMNMQGTTAADFIAAATEEEIADVIYKYGQEVQARQIAKQIVWHRRQKPITTTRQLAKIIREAMHFRPAKIDPVTKSFQAIRIYINNELSALESFLNNLTDILLPEGRIIIIAFHALEDKIVKEFFKTHAIKKTAKSKYAKDSLGQTQQGWLKIITKKPVTPALMEIQHNHRSRSAKLRVAERTAGS